MNAQEVVGQASFDGLWWLCLVIVVGLFIGVAFFIFWLGKLPGETAQARGHPQAAAITVCGWLGLLFPPLWPIALVWAYYNPGGRSPAAPADLKGIGAAIEQLAAGLERLERDLGKAGAR